MYVVICAPGAAQRVPVLACVDEFRAAGATVDVHDAESYGDIDECLAAAGILLREDSSREKQPAPLIVAGDDAALRAVVRRIVRHTAPRGSQRPTDLPENRTIYNLPPIALFPLNSSSPSANAGEPPSPVPSLANALALPTEPAALTQAVLHSQTRAFDLLRSEGGGVTLHGALLGGAINTSTIPWRAHIAVDGALLSDGNEALLACAVVNAGGYSQLSGLPLVTKVDPADGAVSVGVALVTGNEIEVRRAQGRAVEVVPRDGDVPYTDDGADGELTHKKTWWIEPGALQLFHTPSTPVSG